MKLKFIITKKPNGKTEDERWYSLVRYNVALLARRQRHKQRCNKCFIMRSDGVPRFGCGGCAEVELFKNTCRQFFSEERGNK